jgi:uncharacterized protein YjiS (DUF1127 family)
MQLLHSSIEANLDCASAAFAYLCLKRTETRKIEQSRDMAYETNSLGAVGTGIMDRVNALIADYRAKAARRKIYRDTLRELSALSHRELCDLGLNHSEIKRVAYQAAYES